MTDQTPTVVLVHGAFADASSWNGVIERLQQQSIGVVAAANPLRSLTGDAASLRDTIAAVDGPVVLVGHSYGGLVITEAGSGNEKVVSLVYVNAFVPEHGQTAFDLSSEFPGSTLGDALEAHPLSTGGVDLVIRPDAFRHQFAADVDERTARLMAATQRPVTQAALTEALPTSSPAWASAPTWCVFGDADLNIPVAAHRAGAERARAHGVREVAGGSHALPVSQPDAVAETILDAVRAVSAPAA